MRAVVIFAALALGGCNASGRAPAPSASSTAQTYAKISAYATAYCAERGLLEGMVGHADCWGTTAIAVVDGKIRALEREQQEWRALPTGGPAPTARRELEHAKIEHIPMRQSCIVMPLGSAATVNCNN